MNLSKFQGIVEDRGARNATVQARKSWTQVSDWTGTKHRGWVMYSLSKQLLSTSCRSSYVMPWNAEREMPCVTLELRLETGSRSKNKWIQDPYTNAGGQDHVWIFYLLALSVPLQRAGDAFSQSCGAGVCHRKGTLNGGLDGINADVGSAERRACCASHWEGLMPRKLPTKSNTDVSKNSRQADLK